MHNDCTHKWRTTVRIGSNQAKLQCTICNDIYYVALGFETTEVVVERETGSKVFSYENS